ncbi:DUF4136 domain-containing protein [Noviherbaspirillum cavernae]|uniref:DUF4136 domain-containing protein n=1 Tax=Noviherbaspirillum cavernae TaxID=2320862 RepID=A0A418X6H2_9BURK|nr:DUF4136 domain-containing protein [Noviherbaspirillum cavernae]RJG08078.1 DUF4136 domain-containing protein [Noviherbaspirillum cavernae]
MKRWLTVKLIVVAGVMLGGCTTPVVKSNVTSFHELPASLQDKTFVFERTQEQENSLEYRNYENLASAELVRLGFREVPTIAAAKLKASMGYKVTVRDVRVVEPVIVNTYWPGPFWPGPYWRGYYGPFYDPFWYGPPIVERRDSSFQVFNRQLKFALAQTSNGKTVFETTVVSEGANGSLAAVMPYMIRSAFADFPGPNGVPRQIELKMEK